MEYTKDNVIQELIAFCNRHKTKERHIIDKRNYLIAILYYEFAMVEEEIFLYTNLTSRSTINNAKRSAYELYMLKDKLFLKNIKDLLIKYPCKFNDFNVKIREYNTTSAVVPVSLSYHYLIMLTNYMKAKKIDKPEDAVKKLLKSTLKLWEE